MALHEWHWPVPSAEGAVVLVHGAAEHCGRYDHVAKRLNVAGLSVLGHDLPGLGQSPGRKGHIESFDEYLLTVDQMLSRVVEIYPDLPVFLYGHSMGGLIVVRWWQTRPQHIKRVIRAAVLTSPCLDLAIHVPRAMHNTARVLERVWPTMSQPSGIPAKFISHNPEVVAKYTADPLMVTKVSVKWYLELYRSMQAARTGPAEFSVPTLVLQGGGDRIVAPEATREFAQRLQAPHKHYQEFPGAYHELHNEPEQTEVLDLIAAFLHEAAATAQTGA